MAFKLYGFSECNMYFRIDSVKTHSHPHFICWKHSLFHFNCQNNKRGAAAGFIKLGKVKDVYVSKGVQDCPFVFKDVTIQTEN